jgi:hypothetical protein
MRIGEGAAHDTQTGPEALLVQAHERDPHVVEMLRAVAQKKGDAVETACALQCRGAAAAVPRSKNLGRSRTDRDRRRAPRPPETGSWPRQAWPRITHLGEANADRPNYCYTAPLRCTLDPVRRLESSSGAGGWNTKVCALDIRSYPHYPGASTDAGRSSPCETMVRGP